MYVFSKLSPITYNQSGTKKLDPSDYLFFSCKHIKNYFQKKINITLELASNHLETCHS